MGVGVGVRVAETNGVLVNETVTVWVGVGVGVRLVVTAGVAVTETVGVGVRDDAGLLADGVGVTEGDGVAAMLRVTEGVGNGEGAGPGPTSSRLTIALTIG